MADAFAEHLKIVNNRITNQPTGRHFTLPGDIKKNKFETVSIESRITAGI